MRAFAWLVAGVAVVVLGLLQLARPGIPMKPASAEVQAPPQVRQILNKSCYSCHSDERKLAWFDEIVPAYWLVRHDILTAREHLNFSTLGAKPTAAQKATLYEAVNMIQLKAMPLPQFVMLHPEAKVSQKELSALKAYLAPWSELPEQADPVAGHDEVVEAAPVALGGVKPELNGFPFDGTFENWRLIDTTDRGDNYTFRFVLGNDIAIKAAEPGNISPWPKNSRFAKIAWQQERGTDGLMHPGKFIQVELMAKDEELYKDTDGWGWGRWRGLDLEPYGRDAHFVGECMSCHSPMRGDDYVYTLPISPAHRDGVERVNNAAAALPASLPYQPLGWSPITMYVDPKNLTTAALFGNDAAMRAVHPRERGTDLPKYGAGAVLALVTWTQRDDPHWFGARIPDRPVSVEFVEMAASQQQSRYRRFEGANFAEAAWPSSVATQRMNFILGLEPVRLP
jgi:mono/diheme cytochrome c family protein